MVKEFNNRFLSKSGRVRPMLISALCMLFVWIFKNSYGQNHAIPDQSYQLYLTQVAAAEAFLQLNKISTARKYLNDCDKKYRDKEWFFLNAALDHSKQTIALADEASCNTVRISPDGKRIAVGSSDSVIYLYSFPGFKLTSELRGHQASVSTLAFSRDGRRLASGGRDHCVRIWDVESGKQLFMNDTSFTQGIYQVCFSPDDAVVGVVSWERLKERKPFIFGFAKLLDAKDAKEIRKIELDNHPAASLVFTPDGKSLIVSTWGEITYHFDLKTGALNWKYDLSDPSEYNAFHSMDISPDGKTIALGCTDHRVHILNSDDGRVIQRIEPWIGHNKLPKAVGFSADGDWLATGGEDQTILIWNTRDYSKRGFLTGHTNTVSGLVWSLDGSTLISSAVDGKIKEWDLRNPFERTYEICDFGPWQTPFSSDGKFFAAPCSDKKLVVYEASAGNVRLDFGAYSGLCAAISKDTRHMVTSGFDGMVRLWDMNIAKEIKNFKGHTARVDGIAFLEASGRILSVGDSALRVWSLTQEEEINIIKFVSTPFRIVVSPDEWMACIGFNDGTVKVFDTRNWTELNSFHCRDGIQEMAMAPDGRQLAVFSGKDIEVWDMRSFKRKLLLSGHEKSGYGIAFSGDCRYLISGANDQTFKLWNLTTGSCTLTYHGHEDVIYSCRLPSENEIFLSSSQGRVWFYKF